MRRRVREMEDGRRKGRSEEGSEGKRPPRVEVKLQEWIREDKECLEYVTEGVGEEFGLEKLSKKI